MIFIDTGAFLARYIQRDEHHDAAVEFWAKLSSEGLPCFTTNFVLGETLTLLGRRTTHQFAAERARHIYGSQVLQILRPSEHDESAAVLLFEQFADQQVSFCDCISFVIMRRHNIRDVFGFDRHFMIAGFNRIPKDPTL